MKKKLSLQNIFPFLVLGYILAAFLWWTALIYREINENHRLNLAIHEGGINAELLLKLEEKHERERKMLMGEAAFISLSILIISYFLIRSVQKEIKVKTLQNNFILSVTHELKSPLSAMQLAFQTLLKQKVNEGQKEMLLHQGLKETGRLSNLVDNILLAAKIEQKMNLNMEEIPLKSFIDQQIQHFSMLYADQRFNVDIDLMATINADKQALESIVKNIISNAIKYSKETKQIDIKFQTSKGMHTLIIADQGLGIPDEEKQRIFNKFYRVHNSRANNNSGTGLGLYIVLQLMQAHHGSIEISDNKPTGTIFKLKFPNDKA